MLDISDAKRDRIFRSLFIVLIIFFVLWGIFDIISKNNDFIADRFYLAFIAFLALMLYKKLDMDISSVIIGLVPITLHSLGYYNSVLFGIPFDHYLHFSAGFAIAFIFYRYMLRIHPRKSHLTAFILTICITAGIGSFLEIIEFLGYKLGGEGGGILFYGAGDFGEWENAARDMICNTLGAISAGILQYFLEKRTK